MQRLAGLVLILMLVAAERAEAAGGAGPTVRRSAPCSDAAARASSRHGVPPELLTAMVAVESNGEPWAIGVGARQPGEPGPRARAYAGRSYIAPDARTAESWVLGLRGIGLKSLDVGCLQVNLHWHGQAFASLAQAFDPTTNVDYGARLLRQLGSQHGSWELAVAHYHASRRPAQVAYLCRVADALDAHRGFRPRGREACLGRRASVVDPAVSLPQAASAGFDPAASLLRQWRAATSRARMLDERRGPTDQNL